MRLIDADALKVKVEAMVTHKFSESDYEFGGNQAFDYVADILIDEAPTIEPSADTKSCGVSADKSAEQNGADVPIGDLISRAEAIEAVKGTKPTVRSTERNWGKMIAEQHSKELVKALKALPSAETTGALDDAIAKYVADGLMELPSADRPQVNSNSAEEQIAETCDKPKVNSAEWVAEKEKEFEELHRPDYSYEADMVRRLKDALSADRPKGECDDKPEPYVPEASTERVVHCKDCVYSEEIRDGNDMFACNNMNGMPGYVRGDDFCSSGSL